MKSNFFLALALSILICGCKPKADLGTAVAGHWEGGINLPGMQLNVNVDLSRDAGGVWSGKIGIPAQGVRNAPLQGVGVNDESIQFAMIGIPGQPSFNGKLAPDSKTISGDFTQNGQKFTFKLERKAAPTADKLAETPDKGVPGTGLAGVWQGSLRPGPVSELRLILQITNTVGKLDGVMISVDQGNARVPLSNLSEDGGIHFDVSPVGGTFFGEMNTNQSEISGDWRQLGKSTPITFMRLPKAPGSKP